MLNISLRDDSASSAVCKVYVEKPNTMPDQISGGKEEENKDIYALEDNGNFMKIYLLLQWFSLLNDKIMTQNLDIFLEQNRAHILFDWIHLHLDCLAISGTIGNFIYFFYE